MEKSGWKIIKSCHYFLNRSLLVDLSRTCLSSNLPKFTVKIDWEINIIDSPPHKPISQPLSWEKPGKFWDPPPVGWFPNCYRFWIMKASLRPNINIYSGITSFDYNIPSIPIGIKSLKKVQILYSLKNGLYNLKVCNKSIKL